MSAELIEEEPLLSVAKKRNKPDTVTMEAGYEGDTFILNLPADWFVHKVNSKQGRKIITFSCKTSND